MIDKYYIELMNKKIDGLLDEREKNNLSKYLNSNSEALKYYEEIIQTNELLDSVELLDPPDHLKIRTMNSLDRSLYKREKRRSVYNVIRSSALFQPKLQLAFTLGVLIGLICYAALVGNLFNENTIKDKDLQGTIGLLDLRNVKMVDKYDIDESNINGDILLKETDSLFIIDNNFVSKENYLITITFEPNHIYYKNIISLDFTQFTVKKGDNFVEVDGLGKTEFSVYFKRMTSGNISIKYKLILSGNLLFKKDIVF